MTSSPPVTIDYAQLADPTTDLSPQLEQAFGPSGLGLLVVTSIPGYTDLRQQLLPLAAAFAALDDSIKAKYEDENSSFNVGWSCGREILENGQPDLFKGSFYANPLLDHPSTDAELIKQFPSDLAANIWPAELPALERQFKKLGVLMVEVGLMLVRRCDKYVASKLDGYKEDRLQEALLNSKCHKGRLLHYFPTTSDEAHTTSWCGWHKDHGLLTALTSAMYLNTPPTTTGIQNNTEEQHQEEQTCSDQAAGLHVKTRTNTTVKVSIPRNALGFQVGEVMQVLSGGLLQATPHAVIAPTAAYAEGLSRNTFAVFMQPNYNELLKPPVGRDDREVVAVEAWKHGQVFGEFARAKFARYYSSGRIEFDAGSS